MADVIDTTEAPVLYSVDAGIAVITLNRPEKMNALTPEMLIRLDRAWQEIQSDPAIRVAILRGAGDKAFSAGADLARLVPLLTRARAAQDHWDEALLADPKVLNRALMRGTEVTTPVIAAMRGRVMGGGMELMLACDLRIAGESSVFGLPEVRRGLIAAGGGATRVSRQISQARAAEIVLVGDGISAADALSWGLINRVVPDDTVMLAALKVAERMAENGPLAMRKAKQVMLESSGRPIADGFAAEDQAMRLILRSEDAREGSRAFAEKRAPNFSGR
jgi:enoyl-CoA hydratase